MRRHADTNDFPINAWSSIFGIHPVQLVNPVLIRRQACLCAVKKRKSGPRLRPTKPVKKQPIHDNFVPEIRVDGYLSQANIPARFAIKFTKSNHPKNYGSQNSY
jgi:hypothetical protein